MAVDWFRKSAAQGNGWSEYALGDLYSQGKGVLQDDAAGLGWYRQSAGHNNAYGEKALGELHSVGHRPHFFDVYADLAFPNESHQCKSATVRHVEVQVTTILEMWFSVVCVFEGNFVWSAAQVFGKQIAQGSARQDEIIARTLHTIALRLFEFFRR